MPRGSTRRPAAAAAATGAAASPSAAASVVAVTSGPAQGLVIKRSNIRIWCHDCDLGRLQRVVWAGYGARLLGEVSGQPVVRRFLEALPYILNTIRSAHAAAVDGDVVAVKELVGEPVPPVLLSSRDANNLTVLHKAAGLGHVDIVKYVAERWHQGIDDVDDSNRTALHYAAAVDGDRTCFHALIDLGADEGILDEKQKTAGYYLNRSLEIDKSVLKSLPEAPRTPSNDYPATWDWELLRLSIKTKKSRKRNKSSSENASNSNTNNNSMGSQLGGVKPSSTLESIKTMPDLNDIEENKSSNILNVNIGKTEVIEKGKGKALVKSDEINHLEEPPFIPLSQLDEMRRTMEAEKEEDVNGKKIDEKFIKDCTESEKEEISSEYKEDTDNNIIEPESKKDITEASDYIDIIEGNIIEITQVSDKQVENEPLNIQNSDAEENDFTINDADYFNEINQTEDNNDVKVRGESVSEYDDSNMRSTAGASNATSPTKIGSEASEHNARESLIEGVVSVDADADLEALDTPDAPDAPDALDALDALDDACVDALDDACVDALDDACVDAPSGENNEMDPEVSELISSSNMEMLAALVLNGEGARLLGRRATSREVQSFLDNVPTYMKKIGRVHAAARGGNIRELQAALDRRKFAIARDASSPGGATPLHVATLFGRTNVLKYLGSRFPETLSAVDFEGRGALHYAAILPDNGHYYRILQQLGANAKDLDDNGKSAEEYRGGGILSVSQLLADFGVDEEAAHGMLADWVPHDRVSARRALDSPRTLATLERCYLLLESVRAATASPSAAAARATRATAPPPPPPRPLLVAHFLRRSIFDDLKFRITKLDHDLFDVIWPAVCELPERGGFGSAVREDFPAGVAAPDYFAYAVFREFLSPLLDRLHGVDAPASDRVTFEHPPSDFDERTAAAAADLDVDPSDRFVASGGVECARNLAAFELPLTMSAEALERVERLLVDAATRAQPGGTYYAASEVLAASGTTVRAALAEAGLLVALCDATDGDFDDRARLHGAHWPRGRGVYVAADGALAVWINVHDHARVLAHTPPDALGDLGAPFARVARLATVLHAEFDLARDARLGYLSARPTFVGSGLRARLALRLPALGREAGEVRRLCAARGLRCIVEGAIVQIASRRCLGASETRVIDDFTAAVANLLELEREAARADSAHVAAALAGILDRKRSGPASASAATSASAAASASASAAAAATASASASTARFPSARSESNSR